MKTKLVKVICPRCGLQCKIPIQHTSHKWPIDNSKCSRCFKNDLVFVNFVRIVPVPDFAEKL